MAIHRDTIMRLGVKVGEACQAMMDDKLRELEMNEVQVDEILGLCREEEGQHQKDR